MKKILAIIIAAVFVLTALAGCSGGTEASPYAKPAYKVGDTEYSIAEYNFMYMSKFNEVYSALYSNYSSYISYIIDITKPLEEQNYGEEETWDQFLCEETEKALREITLVNEAAKADADYTLSDYYKTALEQFDADLEDSAAEYEMSVEDFVKYAYGNFTDIETAKKMTELIYTYYDYAERYQEQIEVTDDEIKERYESDKNSYDTVDFRYFAFSYTEGAEETEAATETEIPEVSFTEEQKAAALEKANKLAETKTPEEFGAFARENAPEDNKEYYEAEDSTLYKGAKYADIGIEEVAEWLFDGSRKAGETFIKEEDDSAVVFVFMFEKRDSLDYNMVNARHILVMPEQDEEGNSDDAAWADAEVKAQEIYDGFLASEHTEEIFSELASEKSDDTGTSTNGGLYENIDKGQMVQEFEDWCFDDSRESGDTGIVKTSYGFHIMYFVGEGQGKLSSELYGTLANEKYEAWISELAGETETEQLEGYSEIGKFVDDVVAVWQAHAAEQAAESATDTDSSESTDSTESTENSENTESTESTAE